MRNALVALLIGLVVGFIYGDQRASTRHAEELARVQLELGRKLMESERTLNTLARDVMNADAANAEILKEIENDPLPDDPACRIDVDLLRPLDGIRP